MTACYEFPPQRLSQSRGPVYQQVQRPHPACFRKPAENCSLYCQGAILDTGKRQQWHSLKAVMRRDLTLVCSCWHIY